MIADWLNHNLRFIRSVEAIGGLFLTRENGSVTELRSVNGPNYGCVYDAGVVDTLVKKFGMASLGRFGRETAADAAITGAPPPRSRLRDVCQCTLKDGALSSASTISQKLAWQRSRRLTVFKGDFTVDEDPVVALGLLDPPPLASRQVLGHFRG